jgi:hypothetical protein
MATIEIYDDFTGGLVKQDDLAEHVIGDGDSITMFGVRYEAGMDYGDGTGCILKRIGLWDYPHHNTLRDFDGLDCAGQFRITTVAEYKAINPDCTGDFLDAGGYALANEATITVFADNTYCVGEYNGNQTAYDLIECGPCKAPEADEIEEDEAEFTVGNSWPQVGGGVRYLVSGPGGVEITVDEDANGKLSGFVRGAKRDDEDDLLRGAWNAVKSSDDEE